MDIIIKTIFDTEWGIIFIGICIFMAILIEFFINKPKI